LLGNSKGMEMLVPMQKIFFGPPGCGKSFYVRQVAIDDLEIAETPGALENNPNMIETTFHPEYGYGDFVAKLLPQTLNGEIKYNIHAGPLIKALARAYAGEKHVLLVIDEINRGNCAQIFGDIFQLLDRKDTGWSEYGVDPSDLVMGALLSMFGKEKEQLPKELEVKGGDGKVTGYKLRLPPNLSLIGTMNTSDESVYYMDTAFKRRWDFKFMPWNGRDAPESQEGAEIGSTGYTWLQFLDKLNTFIGHEFKGRNVDDKQVGIWFLKAQAKLVETIPVEEKLPENITELLNILVGLKGRSDLNIWKVSFPQALPFTNEKKEKRLKISFY